MVGVEGVGKAVWAEGIAWADMWQRARVWHSWGTAMSGRAEDKAGKVPQGHGRAHEGTRSAF